jgi:hypothetical protein
VLAALEDREKVHGFSPTLSGCSIPPQPQTGNKRWSRIWIPQWFYLIHGGYCVSDYSPCSDFTLSVCLDFLLHGFYQCLPLLNLTYKISCEDSHGFITDILLLRLLDLLVNANGFFKQTEQTGLGL